MPTKNPNDAFDETLITDAIQTYLKTYMAFPDDDQPLIVALWILHTWTFSQSFPRKPWTTPYLYVHSPEKQSGKSLLIELSESLVLNPEKVLGMTSAVLFNLIEQRQPALFIDEVDTIWSGAKNEELRGVLNGGYKHGGYIWRNRPGPDGPEPTKFSTFCPKLLAGIDNGQLPDTIADRCIPIRLRRKREDQQTEIYYAFMAGPIAESLAAEIGDWVSANAEKIIDYMPKPLQGISPRAFEISMPLLQIAHALGIEKTAREALSRLLAPQPEKDSPGIALLRKIREIFDETGAEKLHTQMILERLGDSWNGKLLSNRLRPYEIEPPTIILIGNKNLRGYYRHNFDDAWGRYL